jgi:hypothetical protein
LEEQLIEFFVRRGFWKIAVCNAVKKWEVWGGILVCSSFPTLRLVYLAQTGLWEPTNSSSTRYGAEGKEALKPTFIDGLAEAHSNWRYVATNRALVMPHGKLRSPILQVVPVGTQYASFYTAFKAHVLLGEQVLIHLRRD